MTTINLYHNDCLKQMKQMKDCSVDSIVTDPPYGLSFMARKWDYDVPSQEIWEECLRVLKPGGHLLSFAGSRTYHRMAVRIEDAGFEIRDQIMWIYGSGFPKSLNVGKGWGTALKPAHEPIVMARKPLAEKTIAKNVLEWGTGSINIDDSRIETDEKLSIGSNNRENSVVNFGMKDNKDSQKQHELGRYPANVIHDGLQEDWARYFYCPKTSKTDRNEGLEGFEDKQYSHDGRTKPIENPYQRNKSIAKNNHPTVKPTDLMLYLIRLVTPKNGVTLDPFMGSGSTGKACARGGFSFIGIELEEEYYNIAKGRIEYEKNNPYIGEFKQRVPKIQTSLDNFSLEPFF